MLLIIDEIEVTSDNQQIMWLWVIFVHNQSNFVWTGINRVRNIKYQIIIVCPAWNDSKSITLIYKIVPIDFVYPNNYEDIKVIILTSKASDRRLPS